MEHGGRMSRSKRNVALQVSTNQYISVIFKRNIGILVLLLSQYLLR